MRIRILILSITLSLFLASGISARAKEVTIKPSPTAPWIEVYHDGVLTSEWQPKDGVIYSVLEMLLRDELGWTEMQREMLQVAWGMMAGLLPG